MKRYEGFLLMNWRSSPTTWAIVIFWVDYSSAVDSRWCRKVSQQTAVPFRTSLSRRIASIKIYHFWVQNICQVWLGTRVNVNTEIVSSNRRQRLKASCCSTVYQRYVITTEVQSIQSVFDAFIPLSWAIQCREYLKYLKFSRSSSRDLWFHQNNANKTRSLFQIKYSLQSLCPQLANSRINY